MFSALEWIMKGGGCGVACAGAVRVRWVPDGAEELREGEWLVCNRFVVFPSLVYLIREI